MEGNSESASVHRPPAAELTGIADQGGGAVTLLLGDDGIVRLRWPENITVTGAAARAAVAAVEVLNAGQRRPMLVDMAVTKAVTREARTVFGQPGSPSRIALLGSSPVDRVIANFILGVSSVPVPTRFFTVESEAMEWLRNA